MSAETGRTTPRPQIITAVVHVDGVRTTIDTPVPWWSYAKTVLASAALVLVAKGRLQLDEPVRGRAFTLRQLLQHRAGLRCYGTLPAYHAAVAAVEHPWPMAEMLRRVDAETPAYQPGHGWGYSNVGYLLVRDLVEDGADAPLGPALERLVFRPLGIDGVTVARQPADLDATAWGPRRHHPGPGVSGSAGRNPERLRAVAAPPARRRPAAAWPAVRDARRTPGRRCDARSAVADRGLRARTDDRTGQAAG